MSPDYNKLLSHLPHKPPMRLITSVERLEAGRAQCTAVLPRDCPLASSGEVGPQAGLELIAQAAALLVQANMDGAATFTGKAGRLIACRSCRFDADALPLEVPLTVEVFDPATGAGTAVSVKGRVFHGDRSLLEGAVTLLLSEREA